MAKKKPTYAGFKNSGYYNAANIAALQALAGNYTTDPEKLRAQAEAALRPTLDAQQLALDQQLESALTGYNNQLTGMDQSFDLQRRGANSQFDQSISQAMNQLSKRGLGRSSIVGTQGAALEAARNQALTDLGNKQTDAYNDILAQIALAQSQNAASKAGLSNSYATQLDARVNELMNNNNTALTNLQFQLGQLQGSAYQQYVNQLNKQNKSGGGGGGGGSRSSYSPAKTPTTPTNNNASTLAGKTPVKKPGASTVHTPPRNSNPSNKTPYGVNY